MHDTTPILVAKGTLRVGNKTHSLQVIWRGQCVKCTANTESYQICLSGKQTPPREVSLEILLPPCPGSLDTLVDCFDRQLVGVILLQDL